MTNEIKNLKAFLEQAPFNKIKWKNIKGLDKVPSGSSDIINTKVFLYCWAAFIKLPSAEREKFLHDTKKNKHLINFINRCAERLSSRASELVSEQIIDQFNKVDNRPKNKRS